MKAEQQTYRSVPPEPSSEDPELFKMLLTTSYPKDWLLNANTCPLAGLGPPALTARCAGSPPQSPALWTSFEAPTC